MYKNWSFACFRLWPFDCINYNNVCSYIPSPLKGILSYWPPCSRYYPIHIICVRISIKTSFEALDYCKVHTSIVLRILDLIVTIHTHTHIETLDLGVLKTLLLIWMSSDQIQLVKRISKPTYIFHPMYHSWSLVLENGRHVSLQGWRFGFPFSRSQWIRMCLILNP